MILPDYEKLYEPYSENASLEETIIWISKQAVKMQISNDIRDLAITETFLEMAQGLKFPVGTCDCDKCKGDFGVEWSCVAMNHYLLSKMVSVRNDVAVALGKVIEKRTHAKMLSIIKEREHRWYRRFTGYPIKDPVCPPTSF